MNNMRNSVFGALLALILSASNSFSAKAPFTFDAMMKLARIDDPQLSPDGKTVAFTVQTIDLPGNTKPTAIYTVPVAGGAAVRVTPEGSSATRPRWMPDSKRLLLLSDRGNGMQVWSVNADGTDSKAVTDLPTGVDNQIISPDGELIAFTGEVYPECSAANASPGVEFDRTCNKAKLDAEAASKLKARTYTSLLYRHWNAYTSTRRQHVFLQQVKSSEHPRDMTPGPLSAPPFALGGLDPLAFSPDSTQLTYVANTDPDAATSTNSDLFTVPAAGGAAKRLTTNPGADEGPTYSPDGKYLAYRTQTRAGYESDQWRLAVLDLSTGQTTSLTDSLDKWVESYAWSHDSQRIFFTVDDHGSTPLLLINVGGGAVRTVAQGPTTISSVQFSSDDKTMIFAEQSGSHPAEIKRAFSKGGPALTLTHFNEAVLDAYQLTPLEKITVDGADGVKVDSFVVKPPDFNPGVKYPALVTIHGGPEGDWGESWSYRWNAQVLAGAGYVVILPNPRGSIGYGQSFTDAVNSDWGGHAYDDLMATVDYASNLPYVDRDRMVAAGASYGGYMINWILGHTDRFKALVTHAGVYDLNSEAGTTEELWFAKWEFGGFPWDNPELYAKWSPSNYVKDFKTPTLVTHGELDYRVPIGQGQQLFTALQERKIPSKLVQFPDEGHWILKPQNSQYWYATVLDWLGQYTKPTAAPGAAAVAH